MSNNIPIIDISDIQSEKGLDRIAKEIRQAYTIFGFAIITNHSVPNEIISSAFEVTKEFHSLPYQEKIKIKQNDCFRGYMPLKKSIMKLSTLGETKQPNQLESFIMAFDPEKKSDEYRNGLYLNGDNQFPECLPSLKRIMFKYRDHMLELAKNMLKAFSIALGENKNYLDQYFNPPTFFLRSQRYPSTVGIEDVYGIAPHTDYGFFTFVAQNVTSGLEVLDKNGNWLNVPVIDNSFVLNTGDMCRRISNDQFVSTPHRVINKSDHDRYSIPFFFEPNMKSRLSVVPSLAKQAKYEEIMYGDYLMERINANYGLGKS